MTSEPLWVFGYGSLMWNPGFHWDERVPATLHGFARTFCMRSIHHRGTEDDAGPRPRARSRAWRVLPRGSPSASGRPGRRARRSCPCANANSISSAYVEETLRVALDDGREVEALAYVVDTAHVQYCGGLDLETQAQIIAVAVGGRGPNTEYLWNTVAHLRELGIEDAELVWLSDRVRALRA